MSYNIPEGYSKEQFLEIRELLPGAALNVADPPR